MVRSIAGVNKARVSAGGIFLYTHDFNDRRTAGTAETGVEVLCRIADGALSIGGSVSLEVLEVRTGTYNTAIAEDQAVLSVNDRNGSYFTDALANIPVGATVTVSVEAADEAWNDVGFACGALHMLLENGQVCAGLPAGQNPRTAVGQRADGTLVFYTIDGRQSGHSVGAALEQVAQRLAELGCVSAVCLDGGGSTAITATMPGETAAQIVNRPSDGWERGVSNHIFLVTDNVPTGIFARFHLAADNHRVLAGSRVAISVFALDSSFLPMGKDFGLAADGGELTADENGGWSLLTPAEGGTVTVSAASDERTDTLAVEAIAAPDAVRIKNGGAVLSHLTMAPGDSLQLAAEAVWNRLPLAADGHLFTWSVSGNIGTVTEDGLFSAKAVGTGTLTVSAGGVEAAIPVAVTNLPLHTLEDFEDGAPESSGVGMSLSVLRAPDTVKRGRASAQIDYTLDAYGDAVLVFGQPCAMPDAQYHQLNLWVQGDGSENLLSLAVSGSGGVKLIPLTTLEDTGWQLHTVDIPADADRIFGFAVTGNSVVIHADGTAEPAAGFFRIDQLTASYGNIADTEPPAVTAEITAGEDGSYTLAAAVFDEEDGILPLSSLSVTLDGRPMEFSYNTKTGTLSASLPAGEGGHRLSVFARDASGNVGRSSANVPPASDLPAFSDIEGHWAVEYIAWLKTAGVTVGYSDGSFRPDQPISRQQFVSMLFNYLGLNAEDYADVELPFADADGISDYALAPVKALWSMGILEGTERNGALYLLPRQNLTRVETAVMIGRTQEKGFASAEVPYTDAADVPAYAVQYLATMTAQGVISGYSDGSFRPNNGVTRGQMAKILCNLL